MREVMSQLNLSARAYHCNLKLAQTISDLAGSKEIQPAHLAELLNPLRSTISAYPATKAFYLNSHHRCRRGKMQTQ
jgi:hypothetical protein